MQERARIIGGRFRIWTKKKAGTEVEICLPLKGNEVKCWSS
jgi:signal transduction histidine kinase